MSGILVAARSGDRKATLEAVRDKLAADLDVAEPNVSAQIAGRLSAVLLELEQLGARKVSSLDELDMRRKDRLSKTVDPVPAKRQTRERRPRSG